LELLATAAHWISGIFEAGAAAVKIEARQDSQNPASGDFRFQPHP
jgi:hypothetical protein